MVPHLVTALAGPVNELEQRVLDSMPAIERWFRLEWMEHTPVFYSAVRVRNAGFKLAPVEMSLFPDGWNNLTTEMLPLAVQAAMAAIEKICPEARNLLLIPENRCQSTSYLASVAQLGRIFHRAGLNTRIGSIDPAIKKPTTLALPGGESLLLEPVIRTRRRLGVKDFDPCTILLNNDLRAGAPGILEDIHEQYLLPPLHAGWAIRRRSRHAKCYEEVAKRLGKLLGVDPWLIHPLFDQWSGFPAHDEVGWTGLGGRIEALLLKIRRKYKEYGIKEKPFVVLKADHASLAAGLVVVREAKDLEGLRRELQAGKLASSEDGLCCDLLLQEGVLALERMNDALAEPVVYTMDRHVVGGFYRVCTEDGADEPGSRGARFVPLAFEQGTHLPQFGVRPGASGPNRFYMYGVVARLALLAASYELEATDPDAEVYE